MRIAIVFSFALLLILLSLKANAISVVSDYLTNNTMVLVSGESKVYSIRLQNPSDNEVGIRLDYDDTLMKVLEGKLIYTLQPKETGFRILFNITAPKQPGMYRVSYTVSEVEPGGGSGVPIRLKINRNFDLKVTKIDLKATKNPGKFYINYEYAAYAAIVLAFLSYIFWKRQHRKPAGGMPKIVQKVKNRKIIK